ncbi:short-chain dehydrogenase [Novosphingobium sp. AAP83]|uniref:SDR family NAD(P)-dependent oxidoreductase n=1 Tax=Novosphingobium sp. AAP83 TaxID=1523425 RepID=UPI0006B95724|nr:SDR family oxidoreductase [Novosphingobium sp. AAP83]KPF89315.1 short-chain dehydrogenase [Novosphingobium sp. AAP83]
MNRLENKVCIITGGAGSIGLAAARIFLDEGARLLLVDRSEQALRDAEAVLQSERVATITADVSLSTDTQRYVDKALEAFGAIDVLFSNAGNDGPIVPIDAYPEDIFDSIMAVHVRGAYLSCRTALPHMREGGSVIITSSVVGIMGVPANCAYVAAKHALVGLVRSVAKDVGKRGIRVNTINPGPVDNAFMAAAESQMTANTGRDAHAMFNAMIPLARHVRPDEVARAALFLASDESSYTTGSCLMVDGGMSA